MKRLGLAGLAAVVAVLAASAVPAMAQWSSAAAASHTVATATLGAPSNPSMVNDACIRKGTTSVRVSWTASPSTGVSGYRVSLGTTAGGPYTRVVDVAGSATSAVVGGLAFSTNYFAVVSATAGGWTSPSTAEVSVVTPTSQCRPTK